MCVAICIHSHTIRIHSYEIHLDLRVIYFFFRINMTYTYNGAYTVSRAILVVFSPTKRLVIHVAKAAQNMLQTHIHLYPFSLACVLCLFLYDFPVITVIQFAESRDICLNFI